MIDDFGCDDCIIWLSFNFFIFPLVCPASAVKHELQQVKHGESAF
jgi:hypothetical protein